jgi:cell division septation protein DedD
MAKPGRAGMGLWDRLVLLLAWLGTCGLVYLLGFYVGRGTQVRRLGLEERVVRLPVTSKPPPEGQRPRSESDLTFYDTLASAEPARRERPAPVRLPERPAERVAPAAARPPAPPAEASGTAVPVAPSPPAAAPSAEARAKPAAPPTVPPAPAPVPARPSPPPTAAAAAPPPPAAAPDTAAAKNPAPAPAGPPATRPAVGGWTVQASPTRSRDEADDLLYRLRARGYDASVVRVPRDGDTWYRIQVGRFATSQQATEVMQRLREHEGVTHVFVASE